MKNLLKQFWHYEPFWKWWCRGVWIVWGLGWILIILVFWLGE